MATVPHVISGLGLRKFQADGFLLTRVYALYILAVQEISVKKKRVHVYSKWLRDWTLAVVCNRAECSSETPNDEPVYAFYACTFLKFCVAACFCVFSLRVCGAESVLCQFVLYVCDRLALIWSLWTDAGVLYFAPSTFYVCSMRSTYDEEVAAVSRRPHSSIIELLRVLYVQWERQGWCRYWSVRELWTVKCLITKTIV